MRPSPSCRDNPKPGSFFGRLTMNDIAGLSVPREELNADAEVICDGSDDSASLFGCSFLQLPLDQVKRGLEPAVDVGLLTGLQLAEAEVEHQGDDEQPAGEEQVRAKQQAPVALAQHVPHAVSPQASGTSR